MKCFVAKHKKGVDPFIIWLLVTGKDWIYWFLPVVLLILVVQAEPVK